MRTADTSFTLYVDFSQTGMRLDQFVAFQCDCSRNAAQALIKQGAILLNDNPQKPSCILKAGDVVSGSLPRETAEPPLPDPISLNILFEDDHLLVINKPAGLVVHPAPGHKSGTLVNALLHHFPPITDIGDDSERPGIVHRLDRDTSGVMVIAKTAPAFEKLSAMFADRRISKTYLAVVYGQMAKKNGTIDLPIGRNATHRKKMSATNSVNPREAETAWKVRKIFNDVSLLELDIKTGRTHQIRVHCAALGNPVVGDPTYATRWTGKRKHFKNAATFKLLQDVPRQMLHAWKLTFTHPATGQSMNLAAHLHQDIIVLLQQLKKLQTKEDPS